MGPCYLQHVGKVALGTISNPLSHLQECGPLLNKEMVLLSAKFATYISLNYISLS